VKQNEFMLNTTNI